MTLDEFCERIRSNIDVFEKDYLKKRNEHPHPNEAYPLNLSPELWMIQLDVWLRMLEALGGLDEKRPVYQEVEIDDEGSVEFRLEDAEE